jgi:SAM-dependent methyltransferase
MGNFRFSQSEIDKHFKSEVDWFNFVRRSEAEMIFSLFPEKVFKRGLEIGAGNGIQSEIIARHFKELVCTELNPESHAQMGKSFLNRRTENVERLICDAQDLSQFDDGSFDLVYSSNVLEHVPDINRCLLECWRVLNSENGILIGAMPSAWWKFGNFFLDCARMRRSPIHGTLTNHVSEWLAFTRSGWIKLFSQNKIDICETHGLPFYVGHGNRFKPLIKIGNALSIPGSWLYVAYKGKRPQPNL